MLCAVDPAREEWGPLATASVLAEYLGVPLEALYAATSGAWDDRAERVRRLIAEHSSRERLEQLIAPLAAAITVKATVQRGAVAEVILRHASRGRAGLIVLGSGDRRRFGSGSHRLAMSVAATATAPVLTVPSDARGCAVKRILVPITSSTASRAALTWATALAHRFGASVTLARVAHPPAWFGASLFGPRRRTEELSRQRAILLESSIDRLRHADIVVTKEPEQLDANALALLVSEQAFDLVVMGLPPASHGGLEHALGERVRQCGLVPVLSVRAQMQNSSRAHSAKSAAALGSWPSEYVA